MQKERESNSRCELDHIRELLSLSFYRAKPATDMERSGMEVHCGGENYSDVKKQNIDT